jgi:predicted acylesterase/phospholipase RssA
MRECDLIMKGGVTSGVVYPNAIAEIAESHRLRDIGGTSAGAIGAVFAAAAEYRRQTTPAGRDAMAGFKEIRAVAKELGVVMQSLFQPSRPFRTVFSIAMGFLDRSKSTGLLPPFVPPLLLGFWWQWLVALAMGVATASTGVFAGTGWALLATSLVGVMVFVVVALILVGLTLAKLVATDLPRHDFGVCSGLRQGELETTPQGFTDWITDKVDIIAGNHGPSFALGAPLTVGQLMDQGIRVAAMTTDLSSGRPYQLPLKARIHLFSRKEFLALFPKRVVDALATDANKFETTTAGLPDDLHWLPVDRDFPVVLVARISLSLPGLIQAVPLYRFDDGLRTGPDSKAEVRRCLFSDGGISSNFPIHFFDALLPTRPTFGISLGSWEQARHGDERVELPKLWKQSSNLPIRPITGLLGFLFAILGAAKDWQDTLQSLLPGYAERIVEIRLDGKREGGLNLNMGEDVIAALSDIGTQAGKTLVEEFDFDEHRFRRALSLLPEMEESLVGFAAAYDAPPPTAKDSTYAQVLTEYRPKSYKDNSPEWRKDVFDALARRLAAIGRDGATAHRAEERKSVRNGDTPAVEATLRLIANTDRAPRRPR